MFVMIDGDNMKFTKFLILPGLLICSCGSNVPNDSNNSNNSNIPSDNNAPCNEEEHSFVFIEHVEPQSYERGYDLYRCSKCNVEEKRNYTGVIEEPKFDSSVQYKVLFVGNSQTYFNQIWNTFAEVCTKHSISVVVDQVTSGGYYLRQFADINNTYGKTLDDKLKNNKYDIVFLQENTLGGAIDPASFFTATRILHKKIIESGAQDVLFMPLQRKDDDADAKRYGLTQETITQKSLANYDAIGEELGIPVSHAGVAALEIIQNYADITIQLSDGHPNPAGTYLMSLVHFATVFGVSPVGIEYKYFATSLGKQRVLELAAYNAVFGPSILKDEFKISSIGIGDNYD